MAVAGENVFILPLHEPATLLSRLERAWATARAMGDGVENLTVLQTLQQEGCLPSQWIAHYMRRPLKYASVAEALVEAEEEGPPGKIAEAASSSGA
jgi:hypothetical protein